MLPSVIDVVITVTAWDCHFLAPNNVNIIIALAAAYWNVRAVTRRNIIVAGIAFYRYGIAAILNSVVTIAADNKNIWAGIIQKAVLRAAVYNCVVVNSRVENGIVAAESLNRRAVNNVFDRIIILCADYIFWDNSFVGNVQRW